MSSYTLGVATPYGLTDEVDYLKNGEARACKGMSSSDNKIVILIAQHGMHLCLPFAPAHKEHWSKSTNMLSYKLSHRNLCEVVLSLRQLSSCHAVCMGNH